MGVATPVGAINHLPCQGASCTPLNKGPPYGDSVNG